MTKYLICLTIALGSFSTCFIPAFVPRPVLGAERLTLSFGLLQRSIPIDSLELYARTGKIDNQLAAYAQYAPKEQLELLRRALITPIPLNAVQVSQFLYTPIGERLLENFAEVIQGDNSSTGIYGIRAALILAAADSENFTLLNVLRKFPSRQVSINLARSLEIAQSFRNLLNQTQQAIAQINQQSAQQVNALPPELSILAKPDLQEPGPFKWQNRTITLYDKSRDRSFPADIYLPVVSSSSPVIVISHGLGSDRTSFAYLAEHLASYGFVVAVPEHPGSSTAQLQALLSGRSSLITSSREFIDRPLDVKYLLDELSRRSQFEPGLRGRLNLEQVGVIGQSFGGYTALALAGAPINFDTLEANCPPSQDTLNISLLLQCLASDLPQVEYNLADSRIKAAIAINPVDSIIFGQESLSQIKIPIMIVSSSLDTAAPALAEQIRPFTWLTTLNKYLVLINNATHFSTIAEPPDPAIPVPEQVIGPNPALARRYINILGVAFFQTYVANQQNYFPYLGANYINRISQQPLPLSIVRSLDFNVGNISQFPETTQTQTVIIPKWQFPNQGTTQE